MSLEIIHKAIERGARLYSNVSGGKDGQAMTKILVERGIEVAGLVHADLGRVEWPQSIVMCEGLAKEFNLPLHVVRRSDGLDLLAYWQRRMNKLKGTGKPFWSSSKARYCTSDLKREPINKFYRRCGNNFIISCEGIRAGESIARSKKIPLSIRTEITSTFYNGMTVEEAITNYRPDKRLALTWFPVFNFTTEEVWNTYGLTTEDLSIARDIYKQLGYVPKWWLFHPAYAMGNERVSCMICILGCMGDMLNGAKHNPELVTEMISMEEEGQATFKHNWSLKKLIQ